MSVSSEPDGLSILKPCAPQKQCALDVGVMRPRGLGDIRGAVR
jgi:hypothetical protein